MTSGDGIGTTDACVRALQHAIDALTSPTVSLPDEVRAVARARDALDAALTEGLHALSETAAYHLENAPALSTWASREIGMDMAETRQRVRTARALRDLPATRRCWAEGRISWSHARLFGFATSHVGEDETRDLESAFLAVATTSEPLLLKRVIRHAKAVRHPAALDEAWIRGMDKRDLHVNKVIDGWHLSGFLPIDVGARLDAVLRSLAVPTEAGDVRSASQRRLDGLDEMLTRVLAEGLPTDGTVPPQIHVVVEAEVLKAALAPPDEPLVDGGGEPAELVGFGPIGPRLLAHLVCGAALTPILVERVGRNRRVLDVGRTQRLATAKQRHAVWWHQSGTCATRGCSNPIDHVHHTVPWSHGGSTDLANLQGLCRRCHAHVHARDGTARQVA